MLLWYRENKSYTRFSPHNCHSFFLEVAQGGGRVPAPTDLAHLHTGIPARNEDSEAENNIRGAPIHPYCSNNSNHHTANSEQKQTRIKESSKSHHTTGNQASLDTFSSDV